MKKKIKNFKSEFSTFIMRGNVLELAIGIIIGSAFGKIVTSLVNDILMPLVGILLGGLNFNSLALKIGNAVIMYGSFIQQIIDFLIISFCIFMIIKFVNKLTYKKEEIKEEAKEETKVSEEVQLLTEIRDLLKNKNI